MSFNLDDYEPVAQRLDRFHKNNPDGRVITELVHYNENRCVFRAEIYIGATLVSTGWEEETRGEGYINKTSHLANCETGAVGRALANYNLAGSDWTKRPSREEMGKVQRAGTFTPNDSEGVRKFPNKFPKACYTCGIRVEANEGVSWKQGEIYFTSHKPGECVAEAPF